MSPLSLRRDRAERMLRERFEGLRGEVLASVRGRLRGEGVGLDASDLDAAYAQAWQGLYMCLLEGRQIANPVGWLVLVTYRRAIDEHRAQAHAFNGGTLGLDGSGGAGDDAAKFAGGRAGVVGATGRGVRDLAEALDDRARLRQVFEALRGRLDPREREAAALCYLQELTRAEAAARMGVSEKFMRKLMEGRGPGRQGVAAKVGALVQSIRDGGWCEEQASLMRAFAFGVLDPDGERYQLALMHSDQCSACRAYVASLRGLAAALPPVFLPGGLAAAALAGEALHAGGAAGAAGAAGAGAGAGAGAAGGCGAGGGAAAGVGVSVAGAGGAAGGLAGGGWLLTGGPFSAKLAVGCLLALGVGAGCVALEGGLLSHGQAPGSHAPRRVDRAVRAAIASAPAPVSPLASPAQRGLSGRAAASASSSGTLTPAAKASREFGPERALTADASTRTGGAGRAAQGGDGGVTAHSASVASGRAPSSGGGGAAAEAAPPGGSSSASATGGDSAAAEREFSPG
jgi:DNA-directed RNA polymerase specialized sigma24 family protein